MRTIARQNGGWRRAARKAASATAPAAHARAAGTIRGRTTRPDTRESSANASAVVIVAPALAAIVARHCQEQEGPDGRKQLDRLFETRECFLILTPREKEVCRRILSGYGTEAIASDLGISLHSAFTYRKRAYEKLGISSQNELFAIALRLMARPQPAH